MKKVFNFFLFNIVKTVLDFILSLYPVKLHKDKKVEDIIFVGHRGIKGNKNIKENTFEAFDLAVKSGCNGLEFDVHLTDDNKIVITHDKTLNRVFNINVDVTEYKYPEIKKIFPGIILIEELFQRYKKNNLLFFIEIKKQITKEKDIILSKQVLKILQDNDIKDRCRIITLDYDLLLYYSEKGIKLYPIYLFFPHKAVKFAEKNKLSGVFGNYILTGKNQIKELIKNGFETGTGYLEYKNSTYREINKGVKFIFTERADKTIKKIIRLSEQL